jgi:hypothetical protein
MTPAELLAAARGVLAGQSAAPPGGWPRVAALLARQALENALDEFWESRPATAGLSACPRKSQLACLPFYLAPRTAQEAAYTWAALSGACHYHAYELAPTAGELAGWIDEVATLMPALHEKTAAPSLAVAQAAANSKEGDGQRDY